MGNDKKLQIKPKEEVKVDLGKSPDIGDTIIYRAWFELQKETIPSSEERVIVRQQMKNNFARNRNNRFANSTK